MNITNATDAPSTSSVLSSGSGLSTSFKQGIYWFVAIVALTGNLFFCISLLRQSREVFRKSYTVVVFALAVADILTAIFLLISPRFVFNSTFPQPSSLFALRFYCILIWGRNPLFYFGVVSLYLAVLLTVNRWFAVVRPTQYKEVFTRKRAIIGVAVASLLALIVMTFSAPNMDYHPEKPAGQRCAFSRMQPVRFRVSNSVAFVFKSFIPFLAIVALYLHMAYKLKTGSLVTQQHNSATKKRITKVAAISTLLLIISWMPNQVGFLLFSFGKVKLLSTAMDLVVILAFSNSCVNPYLYGLTVQQYRKAYWELIKCCCPCLARFQITVGSARVGNDNTQEQTERHTGVVSQ